MTPSWSLRPALMSRHRSGAAREKTSGAMNSGRMRRLWNLAPAQFGYIAVASDVERFEDAQVLRRWREVSYRPEADIP